MLECELISLFLADRVLLVSYNILGVENAAKHPDLYSNISPKYLDWDYRKRLLHKEIKNYKPGVICFQAISYSLRALTVSVRVMVMRNRTSEQRL